MASDQLALGRKIYNERCYFCHGYSGDAQTVASRYLSPPPRAFTQADPDVLTRERMIHSVMQGRPGTAMQGFAGLLKPEEIAAVVDFVRRMFMTARGVNTFYHTAENGWPDHERRYGKAYPFVRGELAVDVPDEILTPEQRAGKGLFVSTCVTCHEGRSTTETEWMPRARSYPRGVYSNQESTPDAVSGATPYARHDVAPVFKDLTPQERLGESLFQKNCAFCHARDGTGRNWIGSFLDPHPRNLTDRQAMHGITRERLKAVIREGLPGTTMSAWKTVLTDEQIDAVIAYIARAFYPVNQSGSNPAGKGK